MKRLIPLIIVVSFLASCASSSKELATGDYDSALKKSAKKIQKNPGKFEEVQIFNDSYRMANKRDNAEINRLKQEGNPANWGKIYNLYMKLKSHQDLALSLPPVGLEFQEIDYTSDINISKSNAAEYAYAKGNELMAKNDRMEARNAFNYYNETKGYIADFKDIDTKIAESRKAGMTNIFFRIVDNAAKPVPEKMMTEIQNIDVNDLDKNWVNYDSYIDTTMLYHYSVLLNIQLIEVTPDQLDKTNTIEKKEVPDGFDYVLDANGNVLKDSLGNDVKIPKYKTIQCNVTRYVQTKAARITGNMEYYDNATDKLLKSEPVTAESLFENRYALPLGNIDALSDETRKELNLKPLPYPYDEDMIIQAGETIKAMSKDILVKNKTFLQ